MSNAQAGEEVPFLSGMEREPQKPGWQDMRVTVKASDVFRGDGLISALIHKIRLAMGMLPERGPEDYEAENDLERGIRIGRGMAPRSYNNGGDDEGIKRWHLFVAVLGIVVPIIGAAWSVSMQISAQSAMISNIRDHQREQDERATRVEQQLNQLARDRR
jgi:hypothetical protein